MREVFCYIAAILGTVAAVVLFIAAVGFVAIQKAWRSLMSMIENER